MAALAIESAPPASLPLRYLRLVPAWGLFVAWLLWQEGPVLFASRWAPATLVLVHAFTLGVVGNALLGSLVQFLPVVAQSRPRLPARLAAVLPLSYNLGAAMLVAALHSQPAWLPFAAGLLAASIGLFAASAVAGLRFNGPQRLLRIGLGLALVALLSVAVLGVLLVLARVGWFALASTTLTDVHAMVGLLGSAVLLAGTVGSAVVPMFQGTPAIPAPALAAWIALVAAALVAAIALRSAGLPALAAQLVALPMLVFSVAVLALQYWRRHRRNPALVGFWRLGALALLMAALLALAGPAWPGSRATVLAGTLVIAIGLPSLVLGMVLEVAAFLAWLDLQQGRRRGRRLPGIDALLPEARKARLLGLQVASAIALLVAAGWPGIGSVRLASLLLAAGHGLLGFELLALPLRARRLSMVSFAHQGLPP